MQQDKTIYVVAPYGDIIKIKEEAVKYQNTKSFITTDLVEAINESVDVKLSNLKITGH